jgi:hypothetical protein
VGALSTMARETVSNAKGAGSETAGPWVRAEVEVWLLVLLIAAGDLRPQGSMLRRGSVVDRCERESERSGHCALPWNLSASLGTALRESSGRVDVPQRFRQGSWITCADSRRVVAPELAAGPGDPRARSGRDSPVEHQLHGGPAAAPISCASGAEHSRFPLDRVCAATSLQL